MRRHKPKMIWLVFAILVGHFFAMGTTHAQTTDELLTAAQQGDVAAVRSLLKDGMDVNASNEYGVTALFYACDRGNKELVEILLKAGAKPDARDTFYQATPLTWATSKGHKDIVVMLLRAGVEDADGQLLRAISLANDKYVDALINSGKVSKTILSIAAQRAAKRFESRPENSALKNIVEQLKSLNIPAPQKVTLTADQLENFEGDYRSARMAASVDSKDGKLMVSVRGGKPTELETIGPNRFLLGDTPVNFESNNGEMELVFAGTRLTATTGSEAKPTTEEAEPKTKMAQPSSAKSLAADRALSSENWPSFRGTGARGIGEGQGAPLSWNVAEKENLVWKTEIPCLGLSCPSIWGDKIFVTSAVSEDANTEVRIGLYGDVSSVEEDVAYQFQVFCVDKQTGKILWNKTAYEGKPAVKRHAKSSHANPTVATNGKMVVAFFGSEGLYCYDMNGELKWKRDFGVLDSGWFYDAGYQWGFGSSPVIDGDKLYIQCDIQKGSFVAALDLETGQTVWRTDREEIPTWSSPTVHDFGNTKMLLTHGTKAARGYDAETGKLLWTLPKHSEIVVPTPFVAHNLIYVASGYSPIQPIYAIRPSARGDLSLADNESKSDTVAWSFQRGGPYMPTPIVYGDYMYCCSNSGILTCYNAVTGKQVYRERLKAEGSGRLSFTASPIAGDGKLYLPAEDGRVLVVKAGPAFELLATNPVGEPVLATPAISAGKIILRTQNSLIAVGE